MADPVNIALFGYGLAGRTFHAPLIAATPGLALRSVVTSRAAQVAADFPGVRVPADINEALADDLVELVVIATPDPLHAPHAHAALDAGKHVVVDKPFATTLADARSVAEHAERRGLLLSVFHNRRWDGDFLTLRRLIDDGALGEISQFESHFDRFRPKLAQRWKERPGGGVLQGLGPHLIDQALILFGRPLAVQADLAIQKAGGLVEDYFHLVLRYPRLRAILHASELIREPRLRLAVHGSAGSFVKYGMDPQEEALSAGGRPGSPGWGIDPKPGTLTRAGDDGKSREVTGNPGDYSAYYAALRDAIAGRGPNPVPPGEALAVMEILEAARRAAAAGCELALG